MSKAINEGSCNTTPQVNKLIGSEWTSLDGQSFNNAPESNKHWDLNTKFEEPPANTNLAKPLPKCTKKLKRSRFCSPSKDLKPIKSSKKFKPSKPSTSTSTESFQIGKIMSNIAETHAFIE